MPVPTEIVNPVAPVIHFTIPSVQPLAVNVAVSFPQSEVLFAEITGGVGTVHHGYLLFSKLNLHILQ